MKYLECFIDLAKRYVIAASTVQELNLLRLISTHVIEDSHE
jgi:hypothetical protein